MLPSLLNFIRIFIALLQLGNLNDKLPSLKAGEALLIGEAVILPSIVDIDECDLPPSSNDIPYWELWKKEWKEADIKKIKTEWYS